MNIIISYSLSVI